MPSSAASPDAPAPRPLSTPGSLFATWLARALLFLLRLFSPAGRERLASGAGRLAFALRVRRRVTLDNLRHAFPEKTEPERMAIARGAYGNMGRAVVEALCVDRLTDAELERRVVVEGWDTVEAALREGRGLLVATAHFGGWELMGEAMARRGVRLSAVVRPLSGAFNAELMRSREKSGLRLIAQRGAIAPAVAALRRNEVVAMLVDQALPAKAAVFVPFFGRPAATSPAIVAAATRTGAAVIVAMAAREGDRLRIRVEGPFPPPDTGDRKKDTAQHLTDITAVVERTIRRHPDQWLWMHRRWKVVPRG